MKISFGTEPLRGKFFLAGWILSPDQFYLPDPSDFGL
jgi:hypothetical protein